MCNCNGTGVVKIVTGSMMYTRSCTCDVARANKEKAEQELKQLLEQSRKDQASRLRELMINA